MPHDDVDLAEVFRVCAAFAGATYPGHHGVTVLINLPSGKPVRLPVPAASSAPAIQTQVHSAIEAAILDALAKLSDGQKLTGEKLAEAADYPYNGRFKDTLATLVRSGAIVNLRPGYRLADGE